jgi:hypothetical protein
MEIMLEPLLRFLDKESIPHLMSGSGGNKSVHIQIFFKPHVNCSKHGWREVRLGLWNWILDQADIPQNMRGNGKKSDGENYPYDMSVANFSDNTQAKVMRDFGGCAIGKHPKTLIHALPDKREDIYNGIVTFPDEIILWDADSVIENELDININEVRGCMFCPVDIEWMLSFEAQDGTYQYPKICRDCGKCYGEGSVKIK